MKKKLTSKEKIRRMSGIASVVLILYLILPVTATVIAAVSGFIEGFKEGYSGEITGTDSSSMPEGFLAGTLYILFVTAFIAIIIISVLYCLKLLLSIRRDESPFTEKNGKLIRTIGIAFMLMEPVQIILDLLKSGVFTIGSGITFSAGIVMYCISLVFRYGCELQQESDETI